MAGPGPLGSGGGGGAGPQAQWGRVGFNCGLDAASVWTKAVSDETVKGEVTSIEEGQYSQRVT